MPPDHDRPDFPTRLERLVCDARRLQTRLVVVFQDISGARLRSRCPHRASIEQSSLHEPARGRAQRPLQFGFTAMKGGKSSGAKRTNGREPALDEIGHERADRRLEPFERPFHLIPKRAAARCHPVRAISTDTTTTNWLERSAASLAERGPRHDIQPLDRGRRPPLQASDSETRPPSRRTSGVRPEIDPPKVCEPIGFAPGFLSKVQADECR